jgi:hypothetical protein
VRRARRDLLALGAQPQELLLQPLDVELLDRLAVRGEAHVRHQLVVLGGVADREHRLRQQERRHHVVEARRHHQVGGGELREQLVQRRRVLGGQDAAVGDALVQRAAGREVAVLADEEAHHVAFLGQPAHERLELPDVGAMDLLAPGGVVGPAVVRHRVDADHERAVRARCRGRHRQAEHQIGQHGVARGVAPAGRHVRLRPRVAERSIPRETDRPGHQAAAGRMVDGPGAHADEHDARTAQPRRGAPAEEVVGQAARAGAEVVEDAGARHHEEAHPAQRAQRVEPGGHVAQQGNPPRDPVRERGGRRDRADAVQARGGIGRGADRDRLGLRQVRAQPAQDRVERRLVAEVADAEHPEERDLHGRLGSFRSRRSTVDFGLPAMSSASRASALANGPRLIRSPRAASALRFQSQ